MATPQFDAIPAALRILPHWLLWKYEPGKNGKPTKVPKTIYGDSASSTAKGTWSPFDKVKAAFESGGYDGIGFVFTRDAGFTGVDLDHCRDPATGEIDEWAVAIITRLNSYTEISPSGEGVHVIVRGLLPEKAKHKKTIPGYQKDAAIEQYCNARFFTVTGDRLPDTPADVEDKQAELDAIYREWITPHESGGSAAGKMPAATAGGLTDQQVVEHARLAKNGDKFRSLWSGSLLGYNGDESAADQALMNLIAFYCDGDRSQMERIFSASALGKRDKWQTRPDYRERTIDKALEGRTEFYTPDESRALLAEKARDALAGLPERLKADQRAVKEPAVIEALARLESDDPVEFELILKDIKKAAGLTAATIKKLTADFKAKAESEPQKAPEDPTIKEKALAIASRGDPLKYLIWQAQRNHLGDIDYQKVLLLSIASAASETSHGIQPGGNGEKGSGKSDACDAVYHLIPEDRRLDGSLSPMSLFYLQETGQLKPGMVLFSDDVEYGPIIPIYKRSTGKFQNASNHYTVSGGKDRKSLKLTIPPRVVWWLTSVESVANDQAFDRQYPISTDSSPDHKKRVAREIADRRARPEKRFAEDEGVEVARAIIADMMDSGPFKVKIPQAERATWLKTSDFRGQEQFWDLVDALVVMRWRQHKRDSEGWLIAEDRDLIEAKDLMMAHKVAHFADLTEAEVKLVGVLSDGMPRTQRELTEALGVAQCTLSIRLKSMLSKSSIITEDQDQGKKVYRLNPNADLNASFWQGVNLIDLGIDSSESYCSLLHGYCTVIGIPIAITINNSNRIPSSLLYEETLCKREICGYDACPWKKSFFSIAQAENYNNDQKQHQEAARGGNNGTKTGHNNTNNDIGEPRDTTIRQAGDAVDSSTAEDATAQDAARIQHFAEKAAEVAGKSPEKTPTLETDSFTNAGPATLQSDESGAVDGHAKRDAPGLAAFKEKISRRVCALCGRHFSYDLTRYDDKGVHGWVCATCLMGGAPPKPEPTKQEKLPGGDQP